MATGPGTPQANNVYIPNWEASGKLTVGFSRNINKFALPRYSQYVRTPKGNGYYLKFTNQESGRVLSQDKFTWPDGRPAPQPLDDESFTWVAFATQRYSYGYSSGHQALQMADFNLREVKRATKALKAMTARTMRAITTLTTAANWQTTADGDLSVDHTDTATNVAGGKFDAGTSTAPYIMKGLNAIATKIALDTMGAVESDPDRFAVIINPNTAKAWAASAEIKDYLKGSPAAFAQVTGNLHPNARYGLPSHLYGFEIIIEGTVKVTSNKGATLARSFAFPDSKAVILTKPSQLEGVYGEGSFSTLTTFYYTDGAGEGVSGMDLAVEEFDDANNKLWTGRVLEQTAEVLTCPASGYYLTATDG